jgi:hypothetical protein
MAKKIQAINKYCPKVKLGKTVQLKELVEYIADRTGLNKGDIQLALSELSSAVQFFNKRGEGVKLEGLGIYQPKIDLAGKFSIRHIVDTEIVNALNAGGSFSGEIINRENIGKTPDDLVELWNKENPADIVS